MRTKNPPDEEQHQGPTVFALMKLLFTVPTGVKTRAILGNSVLPDLEVAWGEDMP